MREKLSELTNEMIEERSEKTVCETRYTSGSSPLTTWSRMVELKKSKLDPKQINAARSSGECQKNAASSGEIKESNSDAKPVSSESLNEDVTKR